MLIYSLQRTSLHRPYNFRIQITNQCTLNSSNDSSLIIYAQVVVFIFIHLHTAIYSDCLFANAPEMKQQHMCTFFIWCEFPCLEQMVAVSFLVNLLPKHFLRYSAMLLRCRYDMSNISIYKTYKHIVNVI